MENCDLPTIRKHIKKDSPEMKELLKTYQEGHLDRSCPHTLYDVIIAIIILIILIILIIIS